MEYVVCSFKQYYFFIRRYQLSYWLQTLYHPTASLLVVKWPRYKSTIRQKKTRTLPHVSSPMLTDNRKLHKHQYMYRKDLHISLNLIIFNYWMDYNKIQILQTNMKPSSCSALLLVWMNEWMKTRHCREMPCSLAKKKSAATLFFGAWKTFWWPMRVSWEEEPSVKLLDLRRARQDFILKVTPRRDFRVNDLRRWNHCRLKRFTTFPQRVFYWICLYPPKLTSFDN